MHRKREVTEAHGAWVAAQKELDAAIGIEMADAPRSAQVETLNLRRFRTAVVIERDARLRYARALRADSKPIPDELLWDVGEGALDAHPG